MNSLFKVIETTLGVDMFTVLHTGFHERFVHSNWKTVGMDVFTLLHTGAEERFVHSN